MIWAIFNAMADSTPQNRSDSFETTRWPLVSEAGNPQNPLHEQALDHLLHLYRPALLSHLVKCWRIPRDRRTSCNNLSAIC
jgi:hypothetical protein